MNLNITRHFNDIGCWDVTEVLKVFKKELSTREKTFSPVTDNTKYIASSLFATINSKRILTFSCLLCTKKHKTQTCMVVMPLGTRKSINKDKKVLFRLSNRWTYFKKLYKQMF